MSKSEDSKDLLVETYEIIKEAQLKLRIKIIKAAKLNVSGLSKCMLTLFAHALATMANGFLAFEGIPPKGYGAHQAVHDHLNKHPDETLFFLLVSKEAFMKIYNDLHKVPMGPPKAMTSTSEVQTKTTKSSSNESSYK